MMDATSLRAGVAGRTGRGSAHAVCLVNVSSGCTYHRRFTTSSCVKDRNHYAGNCRPEWFMGSD